jgi:hypothetical protein
MVIQAVLTLKLSIYLDTTTASKKDVIIFDVAKKHWSQWLHVARLTCMNPIWFCSRNSAKTCKAHSWKSTTQFITDGKLNFMKRKECKVKCA